MLRGDPSKHGTSLTQSPYKKTYQNVLRVRLQFALFHPELLLHGQLTTDKTQTLYTIIALVS